PPPPPAGLKETGKTDNSIDISWEKPKGHSAFDIDGYMVSYKTEAETQYNNQNISAISGVLNAVLTGLESDTIYEITVHAYNNDGEGDKLKIQVRTEKPDDSRTCESQQCPGNSTCKQLTADTISCPCNDGYYYDGVSCKEFIVIKVAVTLEEEFTEELKNTSSPVYQELERYITVELYETFKDTPNFQEVVVLGFRI
ncbi:titin, partial, partial [Paramuricea clavata]